MSFKDSSLTNEELFQKKEFELLYEKNLPYIYSLIPKYKNIDPEEVISCSNLGFVKAIKTYSLDKDILFLSYASICIRNEILMYCRNKNKYKEVIFLQSPILKNNKGDFSCLEDIISTQENQIDYCFVLIELSEAIKNLNTLEKQILKYKILEFNQREISEKLNLSQSYISRIQKKILLKLKKICN